MPMAKSQAIFALIMVASALAVFKLMPRRPVRSARVAPLVSKAKRGASVDNGDTAKSDAVQLDYMGAIQKARDERNAKCKTPSCCVAWRERANCNSTGKLIPEKDENCSRVIATTRAGHCECENGRVVNIVGCRRKEFTCEFSYDSYTCASFI